MNWVGYAWWWITEHATVLSAVASAVAAIAIACFTKTLVRVSTDQSRELSRSVDVAERAVQIAVERPWLFVSGVHQLICEPARVGGLEPFVIYMAANHGKAPAIVEDVRATFSVTPAAPEAPMRADERHPLLVSPILGPDEKLPGIRGSLLAGIQCTYKPDTPPEPSFGVIAVYPETGTAIPKLPLNEDLFFWVIVNYRGSSTEGHETSACWRWHDGEGHFVQHGGADYNYTK